MIAIRELSFWYGNHRILDGVTTTVQPDSITGLIGPSGGGKSTLLKVLGGVLPRPEGAISLGGLPRDEVALMFQEGALFDSLTVFDNIAFPLVHGAVPAATLGDDELKTAHAKVGEILGRVGLQHAAFKVPSQLSGGMRRRISLARALVTRPSIVLLDDPTAGLDPVASNVIMNLIVEMQREYRPTMIIASHDLRRLFPTCDELIALFGGRVVFQGPLEALRNQPHKSLGSFVSCRYQL